MDSSLVRFIHWCSITSGARGTRASGPRACRASIVLYLATSLSLVLPMAGWCSDPLRAQSVGEPEWREGLRLLDSASPADVVAAESILRQAIARGGVPPDAVCTLALIRLRQNEPADALQLVSGLATQYAPDQLQAVQAQALRIRLCAALMLDDGRQADVAFKDLVRFIVAGSGDAIDLRYSAITIAVVVAMLEVDLASSPITTRDLNIGRDCMLNSKVHGVASAFSSAYAQASERAGELVRQFQSIADKGIEVVAAENQSRMLSLDQTLSELADHKELAAEIFRNAREQTQQNTRDRRKLEGEIAAINAKLRQATPGHPGPRRSAPPPPPPRQSIRVDEFETRTDWDYVLNNGEMVRVPVTREVRRPQYEIDRDRDRAYQNVLRDYERAREDYDRYSDNYRRALESWTQADQQRRQALDAERDAAEAKRAELISASESIKDQRRDIALEYSAKRSSKEQEAFELELQNIALAAVRHNTIAAAFRPRNFPVISWSQEKTLLQRSR